MPRLVQYAQEGMPYAHWFAPWPGEGEPSVSQRLSLVWNEWPFDGPEQGCPACAWAHWYGSTTFAHFDPCYRSERTHTLTAQQRMTTVNPACSYADAYAEWLDGTMPFTSLRGWVQRSRDDQRREVRRRLGQPRPQVDYEEPEYEEDEEDSRGCLACRTYYMQCDRWDPCDAYSPSRVNRSCAYAEWYNEEYDVEARQRREERAARRRNPDYPEEYRSRRGRGNCRLRTERGRTECPRGCPCTREAHQLLERRLRRQREELERAREWEEALQGGTSNTTARVIFNTTASNVTIPHGLEEWRVHYEEDYDERDA